MGIEGVCEDIIIMLGMDGRKGADGYQIGGLVDWDSKNYYKINISSS